jgi:general secretion pathway protein H
MTLPADRAQSGGFTLIELAVVLAILGVVIAITVPFLAGRTQRGALPAATDEVRAALRAARSAAIAEGRPVAFRADPSGGYWLDRQHYPLVAAAGPTPGLRIAVAGGARIAFYPSGGSSGGRIRIEAAGGWRDIDVDTVTGRAVLRP